MPMTPNYEEPIGPWAGLVDFWKGMKEEAWSFFSSPENFGKFYSHLPDLPEGVDFFDSKLETSQLPDGFVPGRKSMHLGNSAVNPSFSHSVQRQGLAIYLERFAYFFRKDFFIRKAFETLNSETKPEHIGFRKAVETLYIDYKREVLHGSGEESLVEHCYRDEYFMEIDVERVEQFFAWLDVVSLSGK